MKDFPEPSKLEDEAVLFHTYVKTDPKREVRELAKFKAPLELFRRGQYIERGRLA